MNIVSAQIASSFGPFGHSKMLPTLTKKGLSILESLSETPLLELLRQHIASHDEIHHDGTKTIILMISEYYNRIDSLSHLKISEIQKGLRILEGMCIKFIQDRQYSKISKLTHLKSVAIPCQEYFPDFSAGVSCLLFDLPMQSNVYSTDLHVFIDTDIIFTCSKYPFSTNAYIFQISRPKLISLSETLKCQIYTTTQTKLIPVTIDSISTVSNGVLIQGEAKEIESTRYYVPGGARIEIDLVNMLETSSSDVDPVLVEVMCQMLLIVPRLLAKSVEMDPLKTIAKMKQSPDIYLDVDSRSLSDQKMEDDAACKIGCIETVIHFIAMSSKIY